MPRFLFQDLPLGNPCGVPYDTAMQLATVEMALDLLTTAVVPRTTVQTPFAWPEGAEWRDSYLRVDDSNREQLRLDGELRRETKARRRAEATANLR